MTDSTAAAAPDPSGPTASSQPLGVAIIGFGIAGAVFHAPLVAANPRLRVAAVVTANPERAAQARAEHPGARILAHSDELFADPATLGVDLVVVAAPNDAHQPLTEAAIATRLPVVVDKPFTVTAARGRALIDAAARSGVFLTVFQNRRHDGDFLTARRLIAEGALGEVARFESRFERWRPEPKGGWRELGGPEQGAGLLYDLGSHLVDQALTLFGPARVAHAEAFARRAAVKSDDDAFIALAHDGGVTSHLWMSAVTPQLGPRLRVLGSRAAYVKYGLDPQEDALRAGVRPGSPGWGVEDPERDGLLGTDGDTRRVPTDPGKYEAFYDGVADSLLHGAPPPVDPADAVAALELIEEAARLAGRPEAI
jgi:predicted dehydrogenase